MKLVDQIRSSTLGAIAAISTFCAFAAISPYLPYTRIHAQSVGPGGVPGSTSGSGAVSSVFGRTGAVTAQSGDYSAAQVTNAAATNTANTFNGLQTFGAGATLPTGQQLTIDGSGVNWTISGEQSGSARGLIFTTPSSSLTTGFFNMQDNGSGWSNWGFIAAGTSTMGWSASSPNASPDTFFDRNSAGLVDVGSGTYTSHNSNGGLILSMVEAGGSVFTVSGCGTPTATGGAFAGTFTAGASPCNATITLPKAAVHGWACSLTDLNHNANSVFFTQSATTTTTTSYSQTGNVTVGDTIQLGPCEAY